MSVTPPKPHDELLAVASRLSRAAPNNWAEFLKVFSDYADARRDACVQSDADKVLLNQGRARQCVDLLTLFNNAAKQK